MIKNIRNYKRLVILGLGFIFPVLFLSCVNIYLSLDAPKNIKVTGVTSDSAFVSWSSVKKAASYEVMWQIKGEDSWAFDTVKTNYLQINNLWYAQDYIVQVAAVPEDKSVVYTTSDYVKKEFRTLDDVPPEGELARPANVKPVFNQDKTAITVSWDPVQGASYYDIYFECQSGYSPEILLKVVKTVPATQTQFVYNGHLPRSKVFVKVAARNADFSDTCRWSRDVRLEH